METYVFLNSVHLNGIEKLQDILYTRKGTDDMAKGLTRCNVCGKTVEQIFENQMPISIHDCVGYGSKHDGSMLDLDICPDCFDKLIDSFAEKCAINPIKENY